MTAAMWEDKEIKFDIPFRHMRLRLGEKVIDRLDNIEDTKGNGGDRGRLLVTNIRLLWHSTTCPRINMSIGLNTVLTLDSRTANSKLRGTTQTLMVLALYKQSRYEFLFTHLVPGGGRLFASVRGVHRAFASSRLYRELKLRGAVVHGGQLQRLPLEQVFSNVHGVWNLSSDHGSLGTFISTNVRIVWFADVNEAFNISLPYLQIADVQIRNSKFGTALVLNTSQSSGNYVLGFRVTSDEVLRKLYKELSALHSTCVASPIYGVEYKWTDVVEEQPAPEDLTDGLNDIEEPKGEMTNALMAYLIDSRGGDKDRYPIYSPELGLAVENLKEGYTLQKLWEVIPS